jgi:hypothetical protein
MDIVENSGLLIGLLLAIIFLIVVWRVLLSRSRQTTELPESLQQVAEARLDADERGSAVISEQIEEMVKQKLADFQDLADVKLDFATAADGSLEIWVGGERYADADQIPDQRIRNAITDSVATFNQ